MSPYFALSVLLGSLLLTGLPAPAEAGCGCQKEPPPAAALFPNATYSGRPVTLVHRGLQPGSSYLVTFTSGLTGATAAVSAVAVTKRDIADGAPKPQLVVPAPALPLGPVSISVTDAFGSGAPLLTVADSAFTLAPPPVVLPDLLGKLEFQDFQAAVGRDGTVYLSLDLTAVQQPRTLHAQAKGYPLRFTQHDAVFYNTQGVLMQQLDAAIPGLFAIQAPKEPLFNSDILVYSRHEFASYFLQHAEHQAHELDPTDANWHSDGTRHIDHNVLILALAGTLADGARPAPGATPPFKLQLTAASLFGYGITGDRAITLRTRAQSNSYDSTSTGSYGNSGHLWSNGEVMLSDNVIVGGNAYGNPVRLSGKAKLNGSALPSTPQGLLPAYLPTGLPQLGPVVLPDQQARRTLSGPASYQLSELVIKDNATLFIDNTAGPVTLYVTGQVQLRGSGAIVTANPDPEQFALYVTNGNPVILEGSEKFYGTLYAPTSGVDIGRSTHVFGAVVGAQVTVRDDAAVHYDLALQKKSKDRK